MLDLDEEKSIQKILINHCKEEASTFVFIVDSINENNFSVFSIFSKETSWNMHYIQNIKNISKMAIYFRDFKL